ncbi:hypothetical protein GVAV_002556 [Gurleya vavrai]
MKSFYSLKLKEKLQENIKINNYTIPTPIQLQTIPHILNKKDIIAISNTGSGKTLAFVIPIINDLLKNNSFYHTLVFAPTRELAKQIEAEFNKIGDSFGLRTLCLIGGEDEKQQKRDLFSKTPHIIIGTPGRLNLISRKISIFNKLKFLVLDECDKLLEKNYEEDIFDIVDKLKERTTLLFSATMSDNISKMANLSLQEPVFIEIDKTFDTVDKLKQKYLLVPMKYKESCIYSILKDLNKSVIVFVSSCLGAQTIFFYLKNLGLSVSCLHGKLSQQDRFEVLNDFKENKMILIATDVASRGLDIPQIEYLINYDLPSTVKDYIHRVGRTARGGNEGNVINIVTQYDIEIMQKIEGNVEVKMEKYEFDMNIIKLNAIKCKIVFDEAYKEVKEINEEKGIKKRKKH